MARLRHVSGDALTIERRRHGKGFIYSDAGGRRLRDRAVRARIHDLAIPPAWEEVRIAPHPLAHIQACGKDAMGRLQYIYHPEWEVRRTRSKQRYLAALAKALPALRRRVRRDLERDAGERALALGIAVALLDRTAMRVGRERYLAANGTRGAGTLYKRDVVVRDDQIRIRFPAKSGNEAVYVVKDEKLAQAISRIKAIAGTRLLLYRNPDTGAPVALRADQINAYLKEITGVPVRAKDFRTLHASALAAEALAKLEPGESPTARKRQVALAMRKVAAFLQNTPAICRKSYVAPQLIALFETGALATLWDAAPPPGNGGRAREVRLSAVLGARRGV